MSTERENNQLTPRVFLVTGATGAIGQAIAQQLAENPDHEVVLAGRDAARLQTLTEQITRASGNHHLRFELVDFSRQASIQALAGRWTGPLHGLLNNAATTPRRRQETAAGIELQFATNVLGYFWMIQAFRDILIQNAPARVVNVTSYWAGDLDLTDLEFKTRPYNNNQAYRQSKQANRMLTRAFAEELQPFQITVNACHPGDVNSKLSNNLGFGGHESAADGARTPVWLATSPDGQQETGKYFEQRRPVPDRFTEDAAAVATLYQACLAY